MTPGFYQNSALLARMREYLGDPPSAAYLTDNDYGRHPQPINRLSALLGHATELNRSFWDHRLLIAHLDVEYVNFDRPWEPYLNPSRIFWIQRPVVAATQAALAELGIAPLHLLSGRGHHFVWSIPQDHPTFERLAGHGRLSEVLEREYAFAGVPEPVARAFSGLGLVMEFLAHRVLERVNGSCPVSVQVTAVEVGRRPQGREIVSLDLSEYGDPLHRRTLRMPFSLYFKAERLGAALGNGMDQALFPLVMVPIHEMDVFQSSIAMRDLGQAAELAARTSCQIPEQPRGTARLLDAYERSSLAEFHRWFYSRESQVEPEWLTHALQQLPPCLGDPLLRPNDRLLKPAILQHVTRGLLGLGWHPRHIAALVLSRYREDHGWRPGVHFYDPGVRADFYVRLFSGLFATGHDDLVDFNCVSTCEKGYCPEHGACTLNGLRRSALERRRNLALGRPPFAVVPE